MISIDINETSFNLTRSSSAVIRYINKNAKYKYHTNKIKMVYKLRVKGGQYNAMQIKRNKPIVIVVKKIKHIIWFKETTQIYRKTTFRGCFF